VIHIGKERGLLAAALIALVLATGARPYLQSWFDRFLFGLPPWFAIITAAALGLACLRWLDARGWRSEEELGGGVLVAAAAALAFAAIVVAADLALQFPNDISAPWPWSLAFYPTMAFIAEALFHLAPLALLAIATRAPSRRIIVLAALPEAAFQASQTTGAALQAFVALHVFAFGAIALFIFRRHGFLAMLTMRLCYYALWHVAWGHVRLH